MSYDVLPIDTHSIEELRSFYEKDHEERKKGSRALLVIQTVGGRVSLKVVEESKMGFWAKVARFFFPRRYQLANIATVVNRLLSMESVWEQYYTELHSTFNERRDLRKSLLLLNEKLLQNPSKGPLSSALLEKIRASAKTAIPSPAPATAPSPPILSTSQTALPSLTVPQPSLSPSLEELKRTASTVPIHGSGIMNGMNRCYFNSTLSALAPLLSLHSLLQERAVALHQKVGELESKTSLTLGECRTYAELLTPLHKEEWAAFLELPHAEAEILAKLQALYRNEQKHIETTLALLQKLGDPQPMTSETPERLGVENLLSETIEPPVVLAPILEKFSALTDDEKRDLFRWPVRERSQFLQQEKPGDWLVPVEAEARARVDQETLSSPFLGGRISLTIGQFLNKNLEEQKQLLPSFLLSPEYYRRELQEEARHALSQGLFPQELGILGQLTTQLQEYIDLTNRLTLSRQRAPDAPPPHLSDLSFRDYRERDVPEFLTFFLENLLPSFSFSSQRRVEPVSVHLPDHVRVPKFSREEANSPNSLRCQHSIPSYFSVGFPETVSSRRSLNEVFQPYEHTAAVARSDVVIDQGASPEVTPEGVLHQLHALEGAPVSLRSSLMLTGITPPPLLTFHLGRFSEARGGGVKRQDRLQLPLLLQAPHVRDGEGSTGIPQMHEYVLRSVVIHSGDSITFGHYYTYEPDLSSLQPDGSCSKWMEHNDTQVRERDFSEIQEDLERNGYVVFYEKRS